MLQGFEAGFGQEDSAVTLDPSVGGKACRGGVGDAQPEARRMPVGPQQPFEGQAADEAGGAGYHAGHRLDGPGDAMRAPLRGVWRGAHREEAPGPSETEEREG